MSVAHSDNTNFFSPYEMMAEAEKYAFGKTKKTSSMILGLAILAGAFIGLAFIFYITVTTGSAGAGWGLSRLAGGLAFSLGLILVVICGGELFTSSVLSSIAWANKQISFFNMLKLWSKVYIGNLIGALLLLALVTAGGLYQLDAGQWGLNALNIAQHKLHHTTLQAFSLGVLCNLLVCLAIWLTFSSANAMTKAAMTILPVAMFVSTGFEHCVANMFMVPLGIVIQTFAPESFWQQVGVSASHYADLNIHHFIFNNLIPVTLGNIVGGAVLVGLANWSIYSRPHLKSTGLATITTTAEITNIKEITMFSSTSVKEIMTNNPATVSADMPVALAVDVLLDNQLTGAPVVNVEGRVVGFFSTHDVMVELWCQDYIPAEDQKVVDLMSRDVVAVDIKERLIDIAEYLSVDREQLYPTTSVGIATSFSSLSVEERAKTSKLNRPYVMPVMEDGHLVGTITRQQVFQALRPIFGERLVESTALQSA
ncbi:formate transporter FocA [Vibrio sp. RC27]